MNGWMDIQMDKWMVWMNEWTYRLTNEWMDGHTDGQMDGMDG